VSGVLPGPASSEALKRLERILYPGTARGTYPLVARSKAGWTVEDLDGRSFVDLASASGSVPLGAAREDIVEAAIAALRRFGNEDAHALPSDLVLPLAERLLAITPARLTRVDLALNGTEAVETAVRMMRRATGRAVLIGFMGQYHGESSTAAALGAEHEEISRGLRGLAPGYFHVPYPRPDRGPFGPARPGGSGDAVVDYLRDVVLFHELDPGDVAGVVIEPVLGSGGCIAPPDSFWPALTELCAEHGWLLCVDEVKTGFGRTGEMFAVERWGVEPDLMCLGKAMGGGVMPIGAVLGTERAMAFDDVSTGSTWSWLPGACAAALAMIEVFEREPILEGVRALEEAARSALLPLVERYASVGDVRVVGCFIAIEFVKDKTTKERDPDLLHRVEAACIRRGLLGDASTTSFNLQPSLVMPVELMERAAEIVDEAIAEAVEG
jgi:4-aminobutyrate aminotransferase-like enzyme